MCKTQATGDSRHDKLHAGNDRNNCTFSVEWEGEERSGERRTLVWHMRMQQVQLKSATPNQETYLDEYFS